MLIELVDKSEGTVIETVSLQSVTRSSNPQQALLYFTLPSAPIPGQALLYVLSPTNRRLSSVDQESREQATVNVRSTPNTILQEKWDRKQAVGSPTWSLRATTDGTRTPGVQFEFKRPQSMVVPGIMPIAETNGTVRPTPMLDGAIRCLMTHLDVLFDVEMACITKRTTT
eukprot:1804532-Rhodomonas_salina.10